MKKIFIVAYGGGHLNIQLKIAEYYFRNRWEVIFLSTPNTSKVLKNYKQYKVYTFKDLLSERSRDLGKTYGNEIYGSLNIDKEENDAYAGVNLEDLIKMYGQETALKLYKNFGRRIFFPVYSIMEILNKIKPDLVSVTFSAARAERAAIFASKKLGIKVMAIEDLLGTAGAISINNMIKVGKPEDKIALVEKGVPENKINIDPEFVTKCFYVPSFHTTIGVPIGLNFEVFPDYLFCMSDYVKQQLINRNIPENIIYPVGQPIFDSLSNYITNSESIMENNKIVVTTQPLESNLKFLNLIKETLIKLADFYQIVIRYHPSTDGKIETEIFGNIHSKISVSNQTTFLDELKNTILLITQTSTTAIESSILDIKTLSISLEEHNFINFEEAGIAWNLFNPTKLDFENKITELLTGEVKFNPIGLKLCDGKSVERIYNLTN